MSVDTTLRDRLAQVLRAHAMPAVDSEFPADEYDCCADAILEDAGLLDALCEYRARQIDAEKTAVKHVPGRYTSLERMEATDWFGFPSSPDCGDTHTATDNSEWEYEPRRADRRWVLTRRSPETGMCPDPHCWDGKIPPPRELRGITTAIFCPNCKPKAEEKS